MKEKLKTPRDKIDLAIFIIHYLLFIAAILAIITNIVLVIISRSYDLTNYTEESIINVLLCCGIIYSFFTFERFREVRKKFSKSKGNEKVNLNKKTSQKKKKKKKGK